MILRRTIILTLFTLFTFDFATAQTFPQYMQQGKSFFNKGDYMTALERFDLAYEVTKADAEKNEARSWKNKTKEKIKEQQVKILRILKALLPEGQTNIYLYFKAEADKNFALGEYTEALKFYTLAADAPDIPVKNTATTDTINAKNCQEWQKQALLLIEQEKYEQAEQEILKVLEINPKSRNDIVIASAINPFYNMVYIKGGKFLMGSYIGEDNGKPVHEVNLNSFEISRYEITNFEYAAFLNRYGSDTIKEGEFTGQQLIYEHDWGVFNNTQTGKWEAQKGYEYHPVVKVTWYGAYEFCNFYGLSLPTEAQWEYAATSTSSTTSKTAGAGTDNIYDLPKYAWYPETSKGKGTMSVGQLKPNSAGLYDMSGNVWEWCMDWYDENYYRTSKNFLNPVNIVNNTRRVQRGGSWNSFEACCRVGYRFRDYPDHVDYNLGFRTLLLP